MFRIGEFSKMSKVTIKTLRYYDEVGLLKPEKTDKFTDYRFYTTNQLLKLHKIQSFRQIGFSIDEVKILLSSKENHQIFEKRKFELELELVNAQDQLSRLEFILSGKEEEIFMNYQAKIKTLPECTVYSKRMIIPSYDDYFEIIPAIGKQVMDKYPDLKCSTPEYCFTVYLDGEYKEKDIRVEFCEAVTEAKEDFDDIKFKKIESVEAVSIMHKGPYSQLPNAYAYAFKWIEENNYKTNGHPRESYIDGIWNKEDSNQWLTELQIPVVKQ